MGKYRPGIGEEFDADIAVFPCPSSSEEEPGGDSRTRDWVARVVLISTVVAIFVAAVVGFFDGSYDELGSVWDAAGFVLGSVIGYYFTRS